MKIRDLTATRHTNLARAHTGSKLRQKDCESKVAELVEEIEGLQDRLYADARNSVLIIFQAMDAAGKDGSIKHVMSGINPQGCVVTSFKQPSAEELGHDFLWRVQKALPEKGRIGIFNRSYYEEVLVVRVHPEILARQKVAGTGRIWRDRYEEINAFEKHLTRGGTRIIKFFLHLSKHEQKERFLERIADRTKNWKFSASDIKERGFWKEYQKAYQDALRATSTKHAPWYIIPADNKWAARLAMAKIMARTLREIDPQYPTVSREQLAGLAAARKALEGE